ncbi:MAG: 3-ketoacyl-ACP reductase [Candidatus Lokiarchaeota archaeon]|nr:3-ketoacyl-ACP reductase [Candidatus Lokiarchaeota archaeon]
MDGKVALVTGSARGIGFAIATRLLAEGFSVVFNGISAPELPADRREAIEGTRKLGGGSYWYVQADVSTRSGRKSLLDLIEREAGRVDVLVNNAGMAPRERKDILDLTPEEYREVVLVNLEGPFFLTQAVARLMLETLKGGRIPGYCPCIVNISSVSAYAASTNRPAYCISKAGVSMMTTLYATKLAGRVAVHEVRPGIIETDMTSGVIETYKARVAGGLLPIERIGKAEDVAEAVAAIASGRFPYSTGNVIDVDGGFHLRRL